MIPSPVPARTHLQLLTPGDSILAANAAESAFWAARNRRTPRRSTVWLRMSPAGRESHRESCDALCRICEDYRAFGICSTCGDHTEANEAGDSYCCRSHVIFDGAA